MRDRVWALVLRTSLDETTAAIIEVDRTEEVFEPSQLLSRFQAAVTDWVRTTPAGKAAYAESDRDYNVGDLSMDLGSVSLTHCLNGRGLHDVRIQILSSTEAQDNWTYDTLLVDESKLANEEDGN